MSFEMKKTYLDFPLMYLTLPQLNNKIYTQTAHGLGYQKQKNKMKCN